MSQQEAAYQLVALKPRLLQLRVAAQAGTAGQSLPGPLAADSGYSQQQKRALEFRHSAARLQEHVHQPAEMLQMPEHNQGSVCLQPEVRPLILQESAQGFPHKPEEPRCSAAAACTQPESGLVPVSE